MKRATVLAVVMVLAGCEKLKTPDISATPGFGAARERVFKECLEIAKVSQFSTHYADNAEVVSQCATTAYYIALALAKSGDLKP